MSIRPAIFLDRDGVINVKLPEDHYVSDPSQFEFIPGAIEALAILKDLGFLLIVVTNQRGIARGLMGADDLARVHDFMKHVIRDHGVVLDGIYHCPHEKTEGCPCRKPAPGMIIDASRDLDVDLCASYMVGDSPSDMAAARNAGTRAVFIGLNHDEQPDMVFPNLLSFALHLRDNSGYKVEPDSIP